MDKSIKKDTTRYRYAKLQPLVNRVNTLQSLNPAANSIDHHCKRRFGELGVDSYARQLQNDFGKLLLATSRVENNLESKMIKKRFIGENQSNKIPRAALFDQPVLSPVTNAEAARKQKKHKHRNVQKIHCTWIMDLKTELLDILNCILYIMLSPIIFFARHLFALAYSSITMIQNTSNLSALQGEELNHEKEVSNCAENEPEIKNSPENNLKDKPKPDATKFKSRACFAPQKIVDAGTEKRKSQKDQLSQSFGNNLNPEISERGGENYFQYSLRQQDISSVELSSDCLSEKYSRRCLDNKDCKKRFARQYQNSVSLPVGNKVSHSIFPRNQSFKNSRTVVDSKRPIEIRNLSHKSDLRFLLKNLDAQLSETSDFFEKKVERVEPKHLDLKRLSEDCDSSTTETEGTFNINDFRKKRSEKSRPHAFPRLPLRPNLERNSSSKDEKKSEETMKKFDDVTPDDFKEVKLNTTIQKPTILKNVKKVHNESTKETELSRSPIPEVAHRDSSQSVITESKKLATGSGDRLKSNKTSTSMIGESSKPIDAKSKWLEMKKKFYGNDYNAVKEKPEDPQEAKTKNLGRISSMSKLIPAHKIFQYNMLIGRARQMGAEPPSADEIVTSNSCINPLDPLPTSRCLSQTQSLSQWPLDPERFSRTKKYPVLESKPKPKPRIERCFNVPQRLSNRANSSVSTSDVRTSNLVQTNLRCSSNGDDHNSLLRPLDCAGIASAKNRDSRNAEYSDKIDSLVSFCSQSFFSEER